MRKGYIYTLDVTIAILILLVGSSLLYYQFFVDTRPTYLIEYLSQDITGVLTHTKITDLCWDPGGAACSCPGYIALESIVCSGDLEDMDASILSMFAEMIETGRHTGSEVEEIIHEIFVTNMVIDEKRFGFSVLYTDRASSTPLELYNSETYAP